MRAYIVEPGSRSNARSWKGRSRKVAEIARLIHKKYPEIIVFEAVYFPSTKIINILVIHVPETLTIEMIEKEFSCGLVEVRYEPKSS